MQDARIVRVVDGTGRPVAGFELSFDGVRATTGADGSAAAPASQVAQYVRYFDGEFLQCDEMSGSLTTLVIRAGPRLVVDVVDGSTGRSVDARGVRIMRQRGDGRVLRSDESPGPFTLGWAPQASAQVEVDAPAGFGALRPFQWWGIVAPRARSVHVTVPVYPAGELVVRAVDAAGSPVAGARVADVRARGPSAGFDELLTFRADPTDARGTTLVSDVPLVPFTRTWVEMRGETRDGVAWGWALLGPPERAESSHTSDVHLNSAERIRTICPIGCGGWPIRPRIGGPTAPLVVHVRYLDGSPARDVGIWQDARCLFARTDIDGIARIEHAPFGEQAMIVGCDGFRPTTIHVVVGAEPEVVVRESPARKVRVVVVDQQGRSLTAAVVTARCVAVPGVDGAPSEPVSFAVVQLDGDVEYATPSTGCDGVVVLDVPSGSIEYRASLGGAWGETTSTDSEVRIVLRGTEE